VFFVASAGPAPVSGVFPVDVNLHLLEIGVQAIQLSPCRAGPPNASSLTPGPDRWFPGMLLSPVTFRIRVSHQTQEPPFKFPPAKPAMRQRASWRTRTVRSCRGRGVIRLIRGQNDARRWSAFGGRSVAALLFVQSAELFFVAANVAGDGIE